jgi:hypothetical protein
MNQDQIEELAALDALGALDGGDLALWEKESKDNPVVLLLRDELFAAVAQLALLAPAATAPSILRQRIMEKTFGGVHCPLLRKTSWSTLRVCSLGRRCRRHFSGFGRSPGHHRTESVDRGARCAGQPAKFADHLARLR